MFEKEVRHCLYKGCNTVLKYYQKKFCSHVCQGEFQRGKPTRKLTEVEKQLRRDYRHTPEAKQKIGEVSKNAVRTEKWKQNISDSLKGKSRELSEIQVRIRHMNFKDKAGKYERTPEVLVKLSKSLTGRVHSEESNKKRSETLKRKIASGEITRKPENPSRTEIFWGIEIERIFNVNLLTSKWLARKCFDFCYGKILFEIDSTYWHSSEESTLNDKRKDKLAANYKYTLYRFKGINMKKDVEKSIQDNLLLLESIFNN